MPIVVETDRRIAYFSMEVGLEANIPTYSGGLGVLAGDTIRAAADLKVPMVAVTLLHRKGYFYQHIDQDGWQVESPVEWSVDDYLEEMSPRIAVTVQDRSVKVRAWKYDVFGVTRYSVPVYFLDADLEDNAEEDRRLTHSLYGGDARYRLSQEIILGVGGVRMLRALGFTGIERFHMNEAGRLPAELRHGHRQNDHLRRRPVAQHASPPARGFGNEWHEGRAERRPVAQRARRVVDRRMHRRGHRLVLRGQDREFPAIR